MLITKTFLGFLSLGAKKGVLVWLKYTKNEKHTIIMYAGRRENNRAEAKAFTNKAGFSMTARNYCNVQWLLHIRQRKVSEKLLPMRRNFEEGNLYVSCWLIFQLRVKKGNF